MSNGSTESVGVRVIPGIVEGRVSSKDDFVSNPSLHGGDYNSSDKTGRQEDLEGECLHRGLGVESTADGDQVLAVVAVGGRVDRQGWC